MRVAIVSTQMEAAGVQVLSANMVERMLADGIDARLVFLYAKRPAFNEKPYVHVIHPTPPRAADLPGIVAGLRRHLADARPDAVIGMAHYSSPLAAICGALAGVPVRIATQTNPPTTVPAIGRVLDFACGMTGLYAANIAASDMIEACFARYPRPYRRTLKVIHNGIVSRRSALTKAQAREKFDLDPSRPLVVTMGRLSAQKNQQHLIRCVARMPEVGLAIIGEGELRPALTGLIADLGCGDRVKLLGEVPPSAVPDALKTGDVFAFPSLYEAFGLAVAEAMDAGLPVVTSDHPALREVVGQAGLSLPVTDEDAWISAIRLVLDNPPVAENLSRLSTERAKLFLFDTMYERFVEEITRHVRGQNPARAPVSA